VSLAWGWWAETSELTGELGDADRARLTRYGVRPLSTGQGLALFDAGRAGDNGLVVPVGLDVGALRHGAVPALYRGLVRPARRLAAHSQDTGPTVGQRLAGMADDQRRAFLLDLVRTHVATVLGHASPAAVPADVGFMKMGFDSLTAVELRNRLTAATGFRLPATLLFDHPNPRALVRHLDEQVRPATAPAPAPLFDELDRLEQALGASDVDVDGETRAALTRRLQALLWKLDWTEGEPDGDPGELAAATDDEMFALINKELGLS
jgi:hypothetical protein